MKKIAIILAAMSVCCGAAHAQSSVDISGIVDASLQFGDDGKSRQTSIQSGSLSQNRIAFSGTEDLGAGMKALFTIENGFNIDTGVAAQGGLLWGRQAFVGLSSGVGTLTLGRQYEPLHLLHTRFTSHAAGFGDASASFIPTIDDIRFDNSIKYVAPSWRGLTLSLFFALGENTSVPTTANPDKSYGNLFNLQANYDQGPLSAALSYVDKKKTPLLPDNHTKYAAAALSYDFDVAKPYFIYETVRNDTVSADTPEFDFWSLAVDVPLGGGKLNASYGSLKNRSAASANAKSYGLVYEYALSKRTSVYSGYSSVANDAAAAYAVGSGNGVAIAAAGAGADPRAIVFGVRHRF